MAMESKKEIYDIIPSEYIPKTKLIKKGTPIHTVLGQLLNVGIHFPLIAKPDIGMKALGVEKIESKDDLQAYLNKSSDDFLIQELITYTNEVGIFYTRLPNQKKGKITGIVSKEFLSVIGDGKNSIINLIKQKPRSHFQLNALKRKYGSELNTILEKGLEFVLVPYGSHTRGAKFIDKSDQQNERLLNTINSICTEIPGFFYGRLDILYSSLEELSDGKEFSIIEINGAGSEPTHMYDPKYSVFHAWQEILKHWNLLYKISIINNKMGHDFLSFREGTAMLRENNKLETQLKLF